MKKLLFTLLVVALGMSTNAFGYSVTYVRHNKDFLFLGNWDGTLVADKATGENTMHEGLWCRSMSMKGDTLFLCSDKMYYFMGNDVYVYPDLSRIWLAAFFNDVIYSVEDGYYIQKTAGGKTEILLDMLDAINFSGNFSTLEVDHMGTLWAGGTYWMSGLYRYADDNMVKLETYDTDGSLPGARARMCTAMAKDSEGVVWACWGEKLARLTGLI